MTLHEINGYFGGVTEEISKLTKSLYLDSNAIESNPELSDFDKTQALYNTQYKYYKDAADTASGVYAALEAYFMEWLSDESNWSQETFEYFEDTLADIDEVIFEYEDAAVKSIQQKADDSWENSNNWIDERNAKGDWGLFGDSEIKAWERVIKWLEEDYPNERAKLKEAKDNLVEARWGNSNDWIEERNSKGDWSLFGDSEIKAWERVIEWLKKDYPNEINKIKEAEHNLIEARWENSNSWIEERKFWNDWKEFDDSEIEAWERVVKWLNEDYPNEINKIKEAEKNLFEARKEEFNKANEYANTYLESQKTILKSHFNITNSIAEARHEINKELETSKTMYEWLDEDTRELLFNQKDYNTLSTELLRIEDKSLKLQKQYEIDLRNSTLETIESITSEYQMQYETLMKSYEIAKADLEIAKKKQKLNNVLNERNVRMFINGQWQWVANTDDVIKAKSELADAEYAKRVEEAGLTQQKSINNLTRQQDELGVVIKKFENGVIDLTSAIAMAKSAIGSMPSSLSSMYSNSLPSSTSPQYFNSSGGYSVGGYKVTNGSSSKSSSSRGLTLKVGADGNAPAGARVGDIIETAGGNYKIVTADTEGANYNAASGHWSIKIDEEHADGTRYTPGGMTLMGEDGFEAYINSNGHLIPINQPTIGNIASGGVVFNTDQMKSLRTLWDLSNLNMIPDYGDLIANNKTQNMVTNNDYSVTIKDLVIDNSADGQQLISALRRYIGNH